ncbi:sensor histidine kinase [Lacticaseibacillus yichunensis]|uniref:histidine kinase n=1 Tax=Lacticaseibacillus yichunensis TaxID=2486015 RepID=A0ABW4CQQ4_9LACO|nr:sensor histidine kinase [Lacticaseibacillus yichunensis]
MTFRDYLRDHLPHLLFFFGGLLLLSIGLWLDPQHRIAFSTFGYLDLLLTLLLCGFGLWRFSRERRFFAQLQARRTAGPDALNWRMPVSGSQREKLIAESLNSLLQAHQQQLSALIARQQDQKTFIDSWVHEIKVPLAAVELLTDSLDGQAPEVSLNQIALQLDKIDQNVEQVLYYSRLDSFSRDYLLQEYDLGTLVNEVVVSQRNSFIAGRLSFALTGDKASVVTDEKWLRFIFTQLVSNAIKYSAPGGKITATIAQASHEVTLTLTDTGIGIPQDELHRVFEKGFTGTNGRNANQKSTGLGLFLAAQLAEKLGHSLTLTSTVGQGTAVTIHFTHLKYYDQEGATLHKPAVHQ